jgi:steroid delta-isomerase-like uncharacterized protein
MSPQELRTRARRIVEEVYNQGDLAVAAQLIADDCVHHVPVPPGAPAPEPGLEGVKQWLTIVRGAFPDHHTTVDDVIAESDRVVQRLTCRGTHERALFGLPPTGKQVTYQAMEFNRVGPDGKFVETWSCVDLLGLLQQLGAVPALQPEGSVAS